MTTLAAAYAAASSYWETKGGGSRMMAPRAALCMTILGGGTIELAKLGPSSGTNLLVGLHAHGLGKASIASYYAAFRRMLALAGHATIAWPSAGQPPRRVREPIQVGSLAALMGWLNEAGYHETAHLAAVLHGTGMRVEVEALSRDSWELVLPGKALRITGKGGHERIIPVSDATFHLLGDRKRMRAVRVLTYSGHLKRWRKGIMALGIKSKLPTPHAVRHLYATEAYARCRDLTVVRDLLGHADINTTARYIGVDVKRLAQAVGVDREKEEGQ